MFIFEHQQSLQGSGCYTPPRPQISYIQLAERRLKATSWCNTRAYDVYCTQSTGINSVHIICTYNVCNP